MNGTPLAAADLPDEIQALVATLREADERLHAITGGEIDAITDGKGRPLMLQRAQDDVRRLDAARRAAILNSLPANIALLDASGFIVAVNESWRQFGRSNGLVSSAGDVGASYLDACLQGDEPPDGSARISSGLVSVLNRNAPRFDAVYACHSPSAQRWFHMTVTPVTEDAASGVVVMHVDITDRKTYELALKSSELEQRESSRQLRLERSRLVAAQRVAKVGSWETDLSTMALVWSEETYRIHEMDPEVAVTHVDFLQRVHPADRDRVDAALHASIESGDATASIHHRLMFPGGRVKFLEERWQVVLDGAGHPVRVSGTCQDITDRRLDEERIERLNRGYLVLSQINALIVRVRDRDELFQDACRIAVDSGGFELAWIGRVDADTGRIVSVASAGLAPDFTPPVDGEASCDDEMHPWTLAVRTKQAVVVNDIATDPRFACSRGETSSCTPSRVSLPIIVDGAVAAVFSLHAGKVDSFDEAEVALLGNLASDIAFAIDNFNKTEAINYLAYFDPLTGLANRSLFLERVEQCLRGTARALLVLVDIERFKSINDSLGIHAGDDLLRQVANWLADHLSDANLLARLSADQFALVLTDADRPGDAIRHLEQLIKSFHEHPFLLDGSPFRIAAKFGISTYPEDASAAQALIRKAESALKNAKASGNRHLFHTQKMTDSIASKLGQENRLRHALDNDEFVLHYQPKIDVQSGRVVSAEALIRWNDPRTGVLAPPGQFIPVLEETGLIIEVGRWAIARAIEDYLRWHRAGLPAVRIAVNVSPVQLRDPTFVDHVRQLVSVDPLAPAALELEITESMIMPDIEQSIVILHALRAMGVLIAIDDFGTGFSSLGYLAKLPVDTVKIDRSFIADMGNSARALSLVSTMITLAHSFDLKVVAEGVETPQQSSLLKLLRCDEAQGYFHGRPVPALQFESSFLAMGAVDS